MTETMASTLFFWMSHRGILRRSTLKQAIDNMLPNDNVDERRKSLNIFRRRLFELGHAEPIDAALNEWQILPPYFTTLQSPPENASRDTILLCGGRTPELINHIQDVVQLHEIEWLNNERQERYTLPRIALAASPERLSDMSASLKIPIIDKSLFRLLQTEHEADRQGECLSEAPNAPVPASTQCEHWSWQNHTWERGINGTQEGYLLRVTVGFGPKPFLIRYKNQWRRIMSEMQAKFLSAFLQKIPLAKYDSRTKTMTLSSRPPYFMARPLCLCTGYPARVNAQRDGRQRYDYNDVSPIIAGEWERAFRLPVADTNIQEKI